MDEPIGALPFFSRACLKLASLLDPLLECEFFVTLNRDLPAREAASTMLEIQESVGAVHAGIEVAECRFPNSALPPLPAILADGSASGRYVFGGPVASWRGGLLGVEVMLETDGVPRRRGTGAEVMGDPLCPLLWLAEELRCCGEGLRGRDDQHRVDDGHVASPPRPERARGFRRSGGGCYRI